MPPERLATVASLASRPTEILTKPFNGASEVGKVTANPATPFQNIHGRGLFVGRSRDVIHVLSNPIDDRLHLS